MDDGQNTTVRSEIREKNDYSEWVVVLIIIVIIILAAAIVFLILWINKKTDGGDTALLDGSVNVISDSAVLVTWDGRSDAFHDDSRVNLYATIDPNYRIEKGVVLTRNGSEVEDKTIGISASVGAGRITGLDTNRNTYIISTVTDEHSNVHTSDHQLVFTQTTPPSPNFTIQPICYPGFLGHLNETVTPAKIYSTATLGATGATGTTNEIICGNWTFNTGTTVSFQTLNGSFVGTLSSECNGDTYYLQASGSDARVTQNASSATPWIYINNNWCVASSSGTATTKCLLISDPTSCTPLDVRVGTLSTTPELLTGRDIDQRWANIRPDQI